MHEWKGLYLYVAGANVTSCPSVNLLNPPTTALLSCKQWPRRDLIIQTSPLFSDNQSFLLSPFCPHAARILADRGSTSAMCSRNRWGTKKDILGWWERRKGSRHFQVAVLWFAILPQITPVEFLWCRSTIWEKADKCIAGMSYNSHKHTPCILIYNSSQF